MARISIYVPDDLYTQLSDVVNWSRIACDAFRKMIDESENNPNDRTTEQRSEMAVRAISGNLDTLGIEFHQNAIRHGFYDEDSKQKNLADSLMLWITEIAELYEDRRNGKTKSDHIPEFSPEEEEVADLVIRLLDVCNYRGWRIGQAIVAKHSYNLTRPYKHGKKW